MVEVWTSLPLLQNEIRDRMVSLTLSGRKDKPFRYRTQKDGSTIRESTGRARLFQFGDAAIQGYEYVGGGSVGTNRLIPIEIVYPSTGSWPEVADSDYSLLRKDLITNATSVSGVQGRWMKLDVPPLKEDLEDGWQLRTFMVYAVFDET